MWLVYVARQLLQLPTSFSHDGRLLKLMRDLMSQSTISMPSTSSTGVGCQVPLTILSPVLATNDAESVYAHDAMHRSPASCQPSESKRAKCIFTFVSRFNSGFIPLLGIPATYLDDSVC